MKLDLIDETSSKAYVDLFGAAARCYRYWKSISNKLNGI